MKIRANFNDMVIDPDGLKKEAIQVYAVSAALATGSGNFHMACPGLMEIKLNSDSTATVEFFGSWPSWATSWGSVTMRYNTDLRSWTHEGTLQSVAQCCARTILNTFGLGDVDLVPFSMSVLDLPARKLLASWSTI